MIYYDVHMSSPEKIEAKLYISQETLYKHVYADKVLRVRIFERSCTVISKKREKSKTEGKDRRGQFTKRRALRKHPLRIKNRKQLVHWEYDTGINANHRDIILTMVERKSG
jgi:IS30 family transposase